MKFIALQSLGCGNWCCASNGSSLNLENLLGGVGSLQFPWQMKVSFWKLKNDSLTNSASRAWDSGTLYNNQRSYPPDLLGQAPIIPFGQFLLWWFNETSQGLLYSVLICTDTKTITINWNRACRKWEKLKSTHQALNFLGCFNIFFF